MVDVLTEVDALGQRILFAETSVKIDIADIQGHRLAGNAVAPCPPADHLGKSKKIFQHILPPRNILLQSHAVSNRFDLISLLDRDNRAIIGSPPHGAGPFADDPELQPQNVNREARELTDSVETHQVQMPFHLLADTAQVANGDVLDAN